MNELFERLPDPVHKVSLTKETLTKFYNSLEQSRKKRISQTVNYNISDLIFFDVLPRELQVKNGRLIDATIYEYITRSNGYYQHIVFYIGTRTFNIHLYLPLNESKTNAQAANGLFKKCIEKIYLWLSLASTHITPQCSNTSSIYLYMTHFKKNFDIDEKIIRSKHVNSAFTTSCQEDTNVYIYRYEEWFKVLIHECFHCFGMDFSIIDNQHVEQEITKTFNVYNPNGIRVYESYCELWGEVLNVVIFSFMKSKNTNNFCEIFDHLINKELSFSFFQLSKILQKLDISYVNLVDEKYKSKRLEEDSHILSYFFLKTILFSNLNIFERWCKRNNKTLFRFNYENAIKYTRLIIKLSNSDNIKDSLKKMSLFRKRIKMNNKVNNMAKMSIIN